MNDTPPTLPANPPKKSGKKGCLIGCLAVVVIAILLAVVATVVIYPYASKGMKAGLIIAEMATSRIADDDERVVVIKRAGDEFGKLLRDKGFDQDDFLATVSNLVERVIAERAKTKTEQPENEPVDD